MSNKIDIFTSAKPQGGEFFKFKNIGDGIQGTYIDLREGVDSFGNDQFIYVIYTDNYEKLWNIAFRKSNKVLNDRMKTIKFGQIVGFRFDEERDSKKNPGTKVKIIRIYADPKLIDTEWLKFQKDIEDDYNKATGGTPNTEPSFIAPESATPVGQAMPTAKPQNKAIDAIRTLAKTKGLTSETMTEEEADRTIEQYTKMAIEESNLTQIIIALTGYSK
jgi:hypothetical protein